MSQTRFWLLKLPEFAADEILSGDSTSSIGFLDVEKTNGKMPRMRLRLNTKKPYVPREYAMTLLEHQPMAVFGDVKDESGGIRWEGRIDHTADLKPSVNDPNYQQLLKDRLRKSGERESKKKLIQLTSKVNANEPTARRQIGADVALIQPGQSGIVFNAASKISGKSSRMKDKRVRLSRDKLEELILNLFDKKEYYTFKELLTQTDQPTVFLKELLNEMCEKITSGAHIHEFRLKENYRVHGDTDRGSTESSSSSSVKAERAALNEIFK